MNKAIIIIAIIAIIGIGTYLYIDSNDSETETGTEPEISGNNGAGQIQMPITEEEALVVENQNAGVLAVIKRAELPEPGFIVIYRDAGDRPGGIIANSELLKKGTHKNIEVKAETYEIEKDKNYFVMINIDDGDKEFNAGKDFPTANETGGSYMITFRAL